MLFTRNRFKNRPAMLQAVCTAVVLVERADNRSSVSTVTDDVWHCPEIAAVCSFEDISLAVRIAYWTEARSISDAMRMIAPYADYPKDARAIYRTACEIVGTYDHLTGPQRVMLAAVRENLNA